MQQPTRLISTPFAQEGEKTEIQNVTGEFDNSATYRLGFPPITMQSIRLGGKPPKGTDFNGVLFDITENISFLCKGGRYQYNAGLSTLIGGYPKGSNLLLDDNVTEVVSTVAGNQNNPNTDMTGWTFKPNRTTAEYVLDASGETQQQVNYNGGAKWHSRVGGYLENERVVLTNGDIVKSTIDGNTNDPNVDMTGWVPDFDTSAIQAEISTINTELSLKADTTYVDNQLALKADTTYVDDAVGAISTDASKQYATLALANADIANIALNQNVFVSEAVNGGYWYKATAEATSLTKSAYDPLTQAKADATTKADAAEANAKAYADKLENYVLRKQKYLDDLRLKNSTKPRAAVVILLGQSLAAPRNTSPILINKAAPIAKMPVGGASIMAWDFYPTSPLLTGNIKEVASVVDYVEEVGQTPAIGIINAMAGGKFAKLYVGNVAIPARTIEVLMSDNPVTNLNAVLHALCKAARTDGHDPQVMFYSAHGEANAAAGTTEQVYYDLAVEYYGRAQLYAAQAMQKPDYVAPIVLTYPLENVYNSGENDRIIKSAIKRIARDMPKAIDLGGIYQWEASSDRTHPTPKGYIQRGEAVGKALLEFFDKSSFVDHLEVVDVTLSGTTFIATFNHQIVRDTTIGAGQNLAVGLAKDGLEWIDNGAQIAITELIYGGRKITGTLASAPVGTLEQQVLRVAEQTVPAASAVGAENNAGSVIRADKAGWSSIFDAIYINYTWAIPQKFTKVRGV